ncbi:oxygen-dependent protoporphyrinogen oxidase [Fontibacillus phaseoli]|uniref:Coproporphyrinogen III oxidase n=1 Tax=Fontibacillus phaseoli TaxID=1416533 RepID=A0A369B8T5_9BACL|nr:protoporphyrinogen oxidase [Fontibacillus phaseoli]RCX16956.1 oxygen-dependent protoporphyrinogen oxidase [Fontibacillus phaseoli]
MKTVVIVGGGITGLSAAYYLNRQIAERKLDARIVVVESYGKLGGKINTISRNGFFMEAGADSMVTRKPNMDQLIDELGLRDEVVYNATGKSYIYTEGKLKLIPEEAVFGIPLSLESLAGSKLISAEGKVEALKDFYTTNDGEFTKNDSVGLFLEAFLGKEIVEKQIAPVLSGVYSGKLNELTIASTLPYLLDYKNKYGSIMKGLAENRQAFKGKGDRKFFSFQNGVSTLVDKMHSELLPETEFIIGIGAEKITKTGNQYKIVLSDQRELTADFVVMATSHSVAQSILGDDSLNEDFHELKNSSMISVYLGFDIPDEKLPVDGTGFIVSQSDNVVCDACTWTSRKWKHTSAESHLLVRLFYKSSGPSFARLKDMSKEELLEVALGDIRNSLGIEAAPVTHLVTKWLDEMPNYHIKHHELVKSLEQKMAAAYPGVYLAGCSYYGVGIPDCIANGEKTAARIAGQL